MSEKTATNIVGKIKLNAKGYGFVYNEAEDNFIQIEPGFIHTALQNDEVEILLHPKNSYGEPTGEVVNIIKRFTTTFVGTLKKDDAGFFLESDDQKMYTPILLRDSKNIESTGAQIGHKVLVEMTDWPKDQTSPLGKIIMDIGQAGLHDVEMRAIVMGKGFILDFPKDVDAEADKIGEGAVAHIEAEAKNRRDFRDHLTCTIDPVDAKDFDDALSIKILGDDEFEIGVHIADVSHYLHPGTALDTEAIKRATSIYLVDRTIPMLPEVLSNNVCSLVPNQDRLTFGAVFIINKNGDIKKEWFGRTIINSDQRFSYGEVQEILDGQNHQHKKELNILKEVARGLRKKKIDAGAISFEDSEIKFTLDEEGRPIAVCKKDRSESHLLIEDFMLLANKKVAEYVSNLVKDADHMFVYRIHDYPNIEKMTALQAFVKPLGYKLEINDDKIDSTAINSLLDQVDGKPEENMINKAAVRAMSKAIYSTTNIGHWGLSFKDYTHFTSPIRRYPDVLVHRLLQIYLDGKTPTVDQMNTVDQQLVHCSAMEQKAAEAERESIRYKQIEYMQGHVGEVFTGVISGVTKWGLFVEEDTTKAEGLVRISNLGNDFYNYEEDKFALVGQRTGEAFRLGDKVSVRLASADLLKKQIDYQVMK